jgi:hypothetical protein
MYQKLPASNPRHAIVFFSFYHKRWNFILKAVDVLVSGIVHCIIGMIIKFVVFITSTTGQLPDHNVRNIYLNTIHIFPRTQNPTFRVVYLGLKAGIFNRMTTDTSLTVMVMARQLALYHKQREPIARLVRM